MNCHGGGWKTRNDTERNGTESKFPDLSFPDVCECNLVMQRAGLQFLPTCAIAFARSNAHSCLLICLVMDPTNEEVRF